MTRGILLKFANTTIVIAVLEEETGIKSIIIELRNILKILVF